MHADVVPYEKFLPIGNSVRHCIVLWPKASPELSAHYATYTGLSSPRIVYQTRQYWNWFTKFYPIILPVFALLLCLSLVLSHVVKPKCLCATQKFCIIWQSRLGKCCGTYNLSWTQSYMYTTGTLVYVFLPWLSSQLTVEVSQKRNWGISTAISACPYHH